MQHAVAASGAGDFPQGRRMSVRPMTAAARQQQTNIIKLRPGDVAIAKRGDRLETLLGSCVAIILTDQRRTVGVMCHIVHCKPLPPLTAACNACAYADAALPAMYGLLRSRGFEPQLCEAYVYGGGNMFPDQYSQSHVGDDNACWVLDALSRDGIHILHQDLGGSVYRRLSWTVGHEPPGIIAVTV